MKRSPARERMEARARAYSPGSHRPESSRAISRLWPTIVRARYPGWQFSVRADGVIAFRAHPDTGALQRLGPWPLPDDAGEEEVLAAVMLAVAEADGPDAVARLEWLPPR